MFDAWSVTRRSLSTANLLLAFDRRSPFMPFIDGLRQLQGSVVLARILKPAWELNVLVCFKHNAPINVFQEAGFLSQILAT